MQRQIILCYVDVCDFSTYTSSPAALSLLLRLSQLDAAYCGNIIYSYNIDIRSVILINQDGVSEGGDATSPTLYVEDYGRCVCCHLPPRMETSTEALHPITISSRAVSDR